LPSNRVETRKKKKAAMESKQGVQPLQNPIARERARGQKHPPVARGVLRRNVKTGARRKRTKRGRKDRVGGGDLGDTIPNGLGVEGRKSRLGKRARKGGNKKKSREKDKEDGGALLILVACGVMGNRVPDRQGDKQKKGRTGHKKRKQEKAAQGQKSFNHPKSVKPEKSNMEISGEPRQATNKHVSDSKGTDRGVKEKEKNAATEEPTTVRSSPRKTGLLPGPLLSSKRLSAGSDAGRGKTCGNRGDWNTSLPNNN